MAVNLTDEERLQRASTIPAWLTYAFLTVKDSIKYNCAWGFINSETLKSEDFLDVKEDFVANQGKMVLIDPISNGAIVEFPLSVMQQVFARVMPDADPAFVKEYMAKQQVVYNEDCAACKHLIEGLVKKNKAAELDFGLYCVNATNAIKNNETVYKAYKLNWRTFCSLAQQCGAANRLYVKHVTSGQAIPITASGALKQFSIADSKNGVICKLIFR